MLNPAIHTRIYYKLAQSQREFGHTVSIIGQSNTEGRFNTNGIEVISLGKFNRLSFKRFFAGFKILRLSLSEKADAFCIHTPELLWVGLFLKWTKGATLLYDMHEDYRLTILHAKHYPAWVRRPLASLVRGWERFCLRWIDGVSYAEVSYDNVLGAKKGTYIVLRNTFWEAGGEKLGENRDAGGEARIETRDERLHTADLKLPTMLYTGTIAADWGIWETIDWWEKFNQIKPIKLIMAGFSFDQQLIQQIRDRISTSEFADRFQLIGGNAYVPYEQIVQLIQTCSFGTAFYQVKPHIKGKIPTKFYEYMAFDKPLLFTKEDFWEDFDQKNKLGIAISGDESPVDVLQKLESWQSNHDPSTYSWSYDALRMRNWLTEIFS